MDVAGLERMGSRWQKNGQDRIYFNNLTQLYGIATTRYGSGHIASATLDGQKISNRKAFELISYLNDAKVWYDVTAGNFFWTGLDAEDGQFLVDAIKQAVAQAA